MLISVGICTWNRAALLNRTLTEMEKVRQPAGDDWELLVVNNCCTDATDEVVARHASKLPIRRLFEEQQGLSHARNCAVNAARGDLMLWTDDDVIVDPTWLERYSDALRQWPEATIFGGPIIPWFQNTPPRWLERTLPILGTAFGQRDFGVDPMSFCQQRVPYGANYAIRMEDQRRNMYETALGKKKRGGMAGEETTIIRRMLAAGARGRWVPGATVHHYVPPEYQTVRYFRHYFFAQGQFAAYQDPALRGLRMSRLARAVAAEIRFRLRRMASAPEIWARDLIAASKHWGMIFGPPPNG